MKIAILYPDDFSIWQFRKGLIEGLVEDGKNGYLVPIKDCNELANRVMELMVDEEKSKTFGEYGRQKVVKEFDDKIIVSLLLKELYRI